MIRPNCSYFEREETPSPEKRARSTPSTHPFDELTKEEREFYQESSKQTHLIASSTLFYHGVAHPFHKIGEGKFHAVHAFRDAKKLTVDLPWSTDEVVLKIYIHDVKKTAQTKLDDLRAYIYNHEKGIPQPKSFVSPPAYPFWIVEKVPYPVTGTNWKKDKKYEDLSDQDKVVIDFAKKYLTLNAQRIAEGEGEFIGDFSRKNVMLTAKGEPVVVDPSLPEMDLWVCKETLRRNVADWSCGNPKIAAYLTKDFPTLDM